MLDPFFQARRPRRNRQSAAIRAHAQETHLRVEQLIFPLFLLSGDQAPTEVASMPGIYRLNLQDMLREVEQCLELGLTTFDIFPAVPESFKDRYASYSHASDNFYLQAIRSIKEHFPQACIMTDVAMDPYSSDGHDGFVEGEAIVNDLTLPILGQMALAQAQAGADILGPSDMMDGRVGYLRQTLDAKGFYNTSIMSYTAKYASAFYGPFRDALDSAPKKGDKKSYQMNPANRREALIEADLDLQEGADYLMVKPALAYLDVIHLLKTNYPLPIAAYNVSGEYAMLMAAAQRGWLDLNRAMPEMLLSIRRAGADVILSYFAKTYAQLVKNGQV
jgi:porphobilinogen synthase